MPRLPSDPHGPYRILFVCLGNICRSPLAEGVFAHLARESGSEARFEVDSAGTGGWHVGDPPDPRSAAVAERNGIRLSGRGRQVRPEDFSEFDLLVAMDGDNLRALEEMRGGEREGAAKLVLLRAFDPEAEEGASVPDPYYGGDGGFDRVFEMVERSCRALLESLEESRGR